MSHLWLPGDHVVGPNNSKLELIRIVGQGAFGIVFEAKDIESENHYAIKFPFATGFSSASERQSFLNEVTAAFSINHKNVVKVVYAEPSDNKDGPYLISELIEGGTLKGLFDKYHEKNSLPEIPVIYEIGNALIAGIEAINKVMLHRDIKPDNILMDGNTPKIADFGISKLIAAATRAVTFKGGQHILYMAPEGWLGKTNEIQIDMYAVGIVLFELITLSYPYILPENTEDFSAYRAMHLYGKVQSIDKFRHDIPEPIIQVILRLLSKRSTDRFPNWREVFEKWTDGWDKQGLGNDITQINSLLSVMTDAHSIIQERQMTNRKKQEEEKIKKEIDIHQRNELINQLKEQILQFNKKSSLGEIKMNDSTPDDSIVKYISFTHHLGLQVTIGFFWLEHELILNQGNVRFAANVSNSSGLGFNYLLVRKDATDFYGEWIVCNVKLSALARPERHRGPQPFGFASSEEIVEIERADKAIHIFVVDYDKDIIGSFITLLTNTLQEKNG